MRGAKAQHATEAHMSLLGLLPRFHRTGVVLFRHFQYSLRRRFEFFSLVWSSQVIVILYDGLSSLLLKFPIPVLLFLFPSDTLLIPILGSSWGGLLANSKLKPNVLRFSFVLSLL